MNLLDLMVKIGVDDQASKKIDGISAGVIAKGAAIGSLAADAVKAFGSAAVSAGGSIIETGMNFDSAMSQVAATMGKTTDEIEDLRDFAKQMGASTMFSASQAADGLNYMALAGYDAQTSMEMLPTVLNMAAAGGMDLATASDMVTDAQSALGLSIEETAAMTDKMAKAASTTNTSVEQLGNAFLTVGGTAKNLSGGTTELSTALGLLADNGIKGSEGGTALRNVILSLSAPTDKAAAQLEALGVNAFDADGNMRPLNDTFADLNAALGDMTQEEKTQALNTIFNKVDLKSVNALLATDAERWDEVADAIEHSQGAAEKMAETQMDNLAGDLTYFQSALEGVQIALEEKLDPALRSFVQGATNMLGMLNDVLSGQDLSVATSNFEEMLLNGADSIAEGITNMADYVSEHAPEIVDNLVSVLGTIGDAAMKVLPAIGKAVSTIIQTLVPEIVKHVPDILEAGVKLLMGLADAAGGVLDGVLEAIDSLLMSIIEAIAGFVGDMAEAAGEFIGGFIDGIVQRAGEIVSSVKDAIQKAVDKAWQMDKEFKQAAVKFMQGIVSGIKSKVSEVVNGIGSMVTSMVNKVKEIPGKVKSAVSGAVGWLKETGRNIVQGLINGISGMFSNVKDMVSRLAHLIPEPIRKVLNIGSPSKLMKQYGEWTVEGLAIGLEDKAGTIQKAMGNIAGIMADTDFTAEAGIAFSGSKYFDRQPNGYAVGDTYNITLQLGASADANEIVMAITDALESKNRLAGHTTVAKNVRYA